MKNPLFIVIINTITLLICSLFTSELYANPFDARAQLIHALKDDQQHRSKIKALKSTGQNSEIIKQLEASQYQLDNENIDTLNQIIERLGRWPGISDVGENPAKVAMILYKRSNTQQQKHYLPLIKAAMDKNEVPALWYADAYDHHLMRMDLPQKFGQLLVKNTQNEKQSFYSFSSFDALQENRQSIGLPSLKATLGNKNLLLRWNSNTHQGIEIFPSEPLIEMADLALACLDKTYPSSIKHVLNSDADAKPPNQLYPAFFGCFDWHSSVHGHWLLTRIARMFPNHSKSTLIKESLSNHFTEEKLKLELAYFQQPGRAGFERPYGLAWYLQLYAELYEWKDPQAQQWLTILEPLKIHIVKELSDWIPKLAYPIRTGEHSQTAFAFGLALDYAQITDDTVFSELLVNHINRLYIDDKKCPIQYEPSGQDFLSPCLAEADLMRRVLDQKTYQKWLKQFLPKIKNGNKWLPVAEVTDRVDGKLAHLDGLNLARAWMLEGMAQGLPKNDKRIKTLLKLAKNHADSGLAAVTGEHYAGGHWLGSFAIYHLTQRGFFD